MDCAKRSHEAGMEARLSKKERQIGIIDIDGKIQERMEHARKILITPTRRAGDFRL